MVWTEVFFPIILHIFLIVAWPCQFKISIFSAIVKGNNKIKINGFQSWKPKIIQKGWAVRFRVGSRLAPDKHDRFVFLYTVPCARLSSDHRLLWRKWKSMALSWTFLMGFDFHVKHSSSWFHPTNIWVFWLAGTRNSRLLLRFINSEKATQTSRILRKVKFCSRFFFFFS